MKCAGFVLAGGRSSRMGSDKALLPFRQGTLLQYVAAQVKAATGNITLVGDPARYSNFGYLVIADIFVGCGPLAGIHSALHRSTAEWNLIVACDMPEINVDFLRQLVERAQGGTADAVIPESEGLPQPLCAAYRRGAVHAISTALETGVRKVTSGLQQLQIDLWPVPESRYFHNLNTPHDWAAYSDER